MIDLLARVRCTHSHDCPGCPLIDLPYSEQLETKRRTVFAAVQRFSELARSEIAAVAGADPVVEYRRRVKLAVSGPVIGLYARASHRVVDSPSCRVQDPVVLGIVDRVRKLPRADFELYALDVARTPEGVLVTLVVDDDADERAVHDFALRLQATGGIAGVAVGRRRGDSPRLLGRAPSAILGPPRLRVTAREGGPFHYATHGAFAQAHAGQERVLEAAIVSALEASSGSAGKRVLELFAGSGALALALSARGARVHAVEAYGPAAQLIKDAASEQSLDLVVENGDADRTLARLATTGERFDVVVLNPPRRGLSPGLRKGVAEIGPDVVVYVSCEPKTLARNLADFARRGFFSPMLLPHDMMPLTAEVETLAVLARAPVPPLDVIFSDDRLIAVAKPPHEPTSPQGEHEGSLLDRVRKLEGAEEAVPVHRLDVGTSGVCLFARRPPHARELEVAFSEGQKEYVALLRGVARKKGVVNRPLVERGRPREARTRYARVGVIGGHSLVVVRPDQERKHQVRRHLTAIGNAIVGDERYGDEKTNLHFSAKHGLDRPFLHARSITMTHLGREFTLEAPLAPDLELVIESLSASQGGTRDP